MLSRANVRRILSVCCVLSVVALGVVGCKKEDKEEVMSSLAEGKWELNKTTVTAEEGKEAVATAMKTSLPKELTLKEDRTAIVSGITTGMKWGFTGGELSLYREIGGERIDVHVWDATVIGDKMKITLSLNKKKQLVKEEIAKIEKQLESSDITGVDKVALGTRKTALEIELRGLKLFGSDEVKVKAVYERQ